MSAPAPITVPDFGVRTPSAYDLEVALVKFIRQLISGSRLDNPTLNLAQQPGKFPKSYDPDEPPVSFDPKARAHTLYLKVAPRVERGRVPRTVTGEIAVDKLPDTPNIIVQAVSARIFLDSSYHWKQVATKILVNCYDENPDGGGYQDCLNIIENVEIGLTTFGSQGIDQRYPIVFPMEWKLIEADTFPHFIAEIDSTWQLPAGRPMPDLSESIIPGESVEIGLKMEAGPDSPEWAIPK